jgi:tetraacyldisaccharide 4'-kinase
LNQLYYRKLIAGQVEGWSAAFLRLLLSLAAYLYRAAIALRNLLYDTALLKTHRVNAVVISIGNITTGGTGKTPLVIWLCNLLSEEGISCAVLTRGYKTVQNAQLKTQSCIDEPAVITQNCPKAPLIINPDRLAAAFDAIDSFHAEVLIMDDGFQHRRLARDLDIVTIDATCPFGYGRLLPAGLLREPPTALKRAHSVVLTRCDQVAHADLTKLEHQLYAINPNMTIAASVHTLLSVRTAQGTQINLDQLKEKNAFAFCGIGNPDAFFNTLKAVGLNLVGLGPYNDHHHYDTRDIAHICETAKKLDANLVLTTQKDWTKISLLEPDTNDVLFGYLAIELSFLDGREKLIGLIEGALAGKIS